MRADRRLLQQPAIRPGRDADFAGIAALIERCWADYPGCVLDIDAEAPELRALASYYAGQGGALWVAGDVAGMVATRPLGDGAWEICRLYVHPDAHGTGLAHRLLDIAEAFARAAGAMRLELWSDTRFHRAHSFYAKRLYVEGESRALHDLSDTVEYRFSRLLDLETGL